MSTVRPDSTESSVSSLCHSMSGISIEQRLDHLSRMSGYPIKQENGQRKFGPPPDWDGQEPPRGTEVFIGKLPRDMFEDEVIPLFERIGRLFQFRLMMDFSGTNRGFAFARYFNKNDAKKAVEKLNDSEVRNGQRIGVVLSVDNCRLYFGRIPRDKTCDEVEKEIRRITDGVVKVILYPNTEDRTKNRGFIFVEYESHKAATVARRKLIPGQVTMWGCPVEVDWAEPLPEPDDDVIAQVKILYVRNLMPSTTEIQLKSIFELIAGKNTIEHVKKMKDYAFVHFKERKDAALVLQQMHGELIDNSRIEVVWAKPVDKNLKRLKNLQTASNFQHLLNNQQNRPILAPLTPSLTPLASSIVFPPSYGLFTMPPPTQHFLFPAPFQTMSYDPSGSRSIPAFPTCHEPFNSNFTLPTGEKATSTNNSSPVSSLDSSVAAQLTGSPGVAPYVGMPFIDPTAGGSFSQINNQWARMYNRNRCAAGMRSAGLQNAMNNGNVNVFRRK